MDETFKGEIGMVLRFVSSLLVFVGLLFTPACWCGEEERGRAPVPVEAIRGSAPAVAVAGLEAGDFDLELLADMLGSNKVEGGVAGIETFINAVDNPINVVDLDKDKKIDYVQVKESAGTNNSIVLTFVACKSSDPDAIKNQVEIGTLTINQDANQNISMSGNYSSNVNNGSQFTSHVSHHDRLSFGEAFLLASLLRPHAMFMSPWMGWGYGGYYARPFPAYGMGGMGSYRNNYRSTNSVTTRTTQRVVRPSTRTTSPVARPAPRPSTSTPRASAPRSSWGSSGSSGRSSGSSWGRSSGRSSFGGGRRGRR